MAKWDAAPSQPIIPQELIDEHVLERVEENMDDYEKFSCLFLIIDDYKSAFDTLCDIRKNSKYLISKFVKNNQISNWQDKVIESICILQNDEILWNLGVNPVDAKIMFLTDTLELTYKINKYAKAFYKLFDNLTIHDTMQLLDCIYKDIPPPPSHTWPDYNCLEIHLLWWIQYGFISIQKDKWDIDKLLKILKTLNMMENSIGDTLKRYGNIQDDQSSYHYDDQLINNHPRVENAENGHATVQETSTERYDISSGLVIVFNQMRFPSSTDWEYRHGSELDYESIEKTFRNTFGFDVKEHINLNQKEIYSVLDNLQSLEENYDCFVVFVLSHGTRGNIIASDGLECPLDTIRNKLCSKSLNGKPKMLVIQACQNEGDNKFCHLQTDGPNNLQHNREKLHQLLAKDQKDRIPNVNTQHELIKFRDFMMLYSTIPGKLSVRDSKKGTWYVQILCEVLAQHPNWSIEDCVREVNNRFNEKMGIIDGTLVSQVPQITHTLTKVLVFPSKLNTTSC